MVLINGGTLVLVFNGVSQPLFLLFTESILYILNIVTQRTAIGFLHSPLYCPTERLVSPAYRKRLGVPKNAVLAYGSNRLCFS